MHWHIWIDRRCFFYPRVIVFVRLYTIFRLAFTYIPFTEAITLVLRVPACCAYRPAARAGLLGLQGLFSFKTRADRSGLSVRSLGAISRSLGAISRPLTCGSGAALLAVNKVFSTRPLNRSVLFSIHKG